MKLVIAEKPSVGRDIARVLGCKTRGEGFLKGTDYIVTWAIGHLVSLCEPDELDPAYKKWRMEQLPILPDHLPTKILPKTKSQFSVVKKLMLDKTVDKIICATDSGREGELIFRYIYHQAGCTKPVDRLWISSMTDAAIRDGFSRLLPDERYDALYTSARCRAEADWLVGMNASRAFTLKYGALLTLGRVQTPTLKLIAQRDMEIKSFVPEDYYEVRADFGDYEGLWFDPKKNESRIFDFAKAKGICALIKGKTGTVTELRTEKKKMPPPQLFDLTSLQREANRMLGLSAAKTLSIAQSLYEKHKLITYPRTDSRYLPMDMIPKITSVISDMPDKYREFAQTLLPKPPITGRVYNDSKVSDHHAIVPTGHYGALGKLSDPERTVFDMVVRRLLAALYPDYEYESTTVVTSALDHSFRTVGQTPITEGWKVLYPSRRDEEKEPRIPTLKKGDTRDIQNASAKKLKTKPPVPHTDASLLGLMEHAGRMIEDEALRDSMKDSGLGTPATRAAILERLIQVGYVSRKGKTLTATDKGLKLIQIVPEELASPETTGKWERALSRMSRENDAEALSAQSEKFIESIRRFSVFLVDSAKTCTASVQFEAEARTGKKHTSSKKTLTPLGRKCPFCGEGEVTANEKAFGCSRWREGCKFTVWRDTLVRQGGPKLAVNHMKKLLDVGQLELAGFHLSMEQGIFKAIKQSKIE